ncbi:LysM peptidoglycan-binding domain-containing protein, partial [Klebsiella pneumoniae]
YGFDDLALEAPAQLVSVAVPSPVRLADIASLTGIPLSLLKDFNPHLIRGITPPGASTYRIWVPMEEAAGVESLRERLGALRIRGMHSVTTEVATPSEHVVAAGESLAKIAALYGLSVRQLKRLNHLRAGRVTPGTRLTLS